MKAGEGARAMVWKKGEKKESRKQTEEKKGKGKWDKEAEEEKLRELEMIWEERQYVK